jgi:hypothetical protein
MRNVALFLGLGLFVAFNVGCSFQKWDDVKQSNAGNAGAEQGGSGGDDATGGKSTKGGSSAKVGSTAKGGSTAKNSAATGGAISDGGSKNDGGTTSASGGSGSTNGGTSSSGGTSSTGGLTAKGGTTSTGGTIAVGAPFVVSVTPTNGSDGIASNAKIVLKFSEAMDTFSVASALTIPPLANNAYSQVGQLTIRRLRLRQVAV